MDFILVYIILERAFLRFSEEDTLNWAKFSSLWLGWWKYTWCHFKLWVWEVRVCFNFREYDQPAWMFRSWASKAYKIKSPKKKNIPQAEVHTNADLGNDSIKVYEETAMMMKERVKGGCICNITAAAALWEHQVSLEYHQSALNFAKYDWHSYIAFLFLYAYAYADMHICVPSSCIFMTRNTNKMMMTTQCNAMVTCGRNKIAENHCLSDLQRWITRLLKIENFIVIAIMQQTWRKIL